MIAFVEMHRGDLTKLMKFLKKNLSNLHYFNNCDCHVCSRLAQEQSNELLSCVTVSF